MWNDNSSYKRITFNAIFFLVLIFIFSNHGAAIKRIVYAENSNSEIENEINENIDNILHDIDTDDFDVLINGDFGIDYFEGLSFKDLVSKILSGEYFLEYDSLIEYFSSNFSESIKGILSFILTIFAVIVLYEIFKHFCVDKYSDLKKCIKFVFATTIALILFVLLKNLTDNLTEIIEQIFSVSEVLFPILLGLVLSSGATGTHSVYSSISVFVLNSGLYIFKFILLPLAVSIIVLTIFGIVVSDQKFSKFIGLLKYIFKLIITILFSIFGLFSVLNIVASGLKDGVSLKITKYAIKNYIPILGGYISEGFDFVKTCSIMVKNAFGICGIFLLVFVVVKPLILYVVYIFGFKVLSVLTSFISSSFYSNNFDEISKGFSYFLAVLIGLFLIMFVFIFLLIISVSVS